MFFDNNFCDWLIENRISCSLRSISEVKQELIQKGIELELIRERINIIYTQERENEVFDIIFNKRFEKFTNPDKKTKLKIFNYFQRRGFGYTLIKEQINI